MHYFVLFIASIWLTVAPADANYYTDVDCPAVNYSPCTCTTGMLIGTNVPEGFESYKVICERVSIAEIKAVFRRVKPRKLGSITLKLSPSETSTIPADILSNSSATHLTIKCEGTYNLVVDQNAFRTSKNECFWFTIDGCDLRKQPNFAFLSDLQELSTIDIKESKNFNSFQGLPSSSSIYLTIENSKGFENLAYEPNSSLTKIGTLNLYNNHMGDVVTGKVLNFWALSSKETLESLSMDDNNLTRIPEMPWSFPKLNTLSLMRNSIKSVDTLPFVKSDLVKVLSLEGNSITSIKPNFFADGEQYAVGLDDNKLTRFDSAVYQSMLEVMYQRDKKGISYTSLFIYRNPIECDCHLAWLIVHKRHLLKYIFGGQCSNSTMFEDLKPEGFRDCPTFTCPVGVDGQFPNPLTSSSFYSCTAGKSTLVKCPAGKVFSPTLLKQDLFQNVPPCK